VAWRELPAGPTTIAVASAATALLREEVVSPKITLLSALAATGETRERLLHYQAGMWRIDVEDIDH